MELTVTAPNRIDLAGGTTDLYPLYLLMDGGCTVNAAVTVTSTVTLRLGEAAGIRVESVDLGESVEARSVEQLPVSGPLGLVCRAIRAMPPTGPLEVRTRNEAPAGSGLGASSALLVALLKGLATLRGEELAGEGLIDLAASVETASLGMPAGKQDYIGALFGGVSIIEFGYRGFRRVVPREESSLRSGLEEMLILSYTGQSRFSGANNWEVIKDFIDDRRGVRGKLLRIRDTARALAQALLEGKLDDLPALVQAEWDARRELAPDVSTPRIEKIMGAASAAGALASKICGAGGGGCMITLAPPELRSDVEKAVAEAGGSVMPFSLDWEGARML